MNKYRRNNWLLDAGRAGWSVVASFLLFNAVFVAIAKAAPTVNTKTYSSKLDNPIEPDDLGEVIGTITGAFVGAIGAIAVAAIVYGGVIYITAAGNEESVKKAKSIILYSIIGLVVALLAYVIVDFVINSLLGGK